MDTVSARNFAGTNDPHGWIGLRFQSQPGGPPNNVLMHINMRDPANILQQEAIGILGVNLIYSAFYELQTKESFLEGVALMQQRNRLSYEVVMDKPPKLVVLMVLVLIGAFAGHRAYRSFKDAEADDEIQQPQSEANPQSNQPPNQLLLGSSAQVHGLHSIQIHPSIKLDFMSRHEVFALRKQYVSEHPLVLLPYEPSPAVFGGIEDNKPWWGLYGLLYYGPGEKGIEGPSEESRFLINPYLLMGVRECNALITTYTPDGSDSFYPQATELSWNADESLATAKFQVSGYRAHLDKIDARGDRQALYWTDYNARDFGLNYFYVEPANSTNLNLGASLLETRQFLHRGGSCGYPGGCNNMSPHEEQLIFSVPHLPAKAYIKLWQKRPSSVSDSADMAFLIEME